MRPLSARVTTTGATTMQWHHNSIIIVVAIRCSREVRGIRCRGDGHIDSGNARLIVRVYPADYAFELHVLLVFRLFSVYWKTYNTRYVRT